MFQLTDSHIDFIFDDLRSRGIVTCALRDNIVDHVCVLIEESLDDEAEFEACYTRVIGRFYREELSEIEAETQFLLTRGRCWFLLGRMQMFWLLLFLLVGPIVAWTLVSLSSAGVHARESVLMAWEGAFVFSLFPLGSLLVLFFTPERFDPVMPRGCRVRIGQRPFIEVIAG